MGEPQIAKLLPIESSTAWTVWMEMPPMHRSHDRRSHHHRPGPGECRHLSHLHVESLSLFLDRLTGDWTSADAGMVLDDLTTRSRWPLAVLTRVSSFGSPTR